MFREDGGPARLDYQVGCDAEWVTQQGHVWGWLGTTSVEFTIVRTGATYWYEAPRFTYAALLEVTPTGFVRLYPGLWEMEP